MQLDLVCRECGGNRFDYPLMLNANSVIKCADCGHKVSTVADMQQKVVDAMARQGAEPAG